MQRAIDQAILADPANAELMASMLGLYKAITCNACGGEGHNSLNCATKKALDSTFKGLGLKAQWGRVKSEIISDNVNAALSVRDQIRELRRLAKEERIQVRHAEATAIIGLRQVVRQGHHGQPLPEQQNLGNLQPPQAPRPGDAMEQEVPAHLRPPPPFRFPEGQRVGGLRPTGSKEK